MVTLRTSATVERLDFLRQFDSRATAEEIFCFDLLAVAACRSAHSDEDGCCAGPSASLVRNALSCAHAQPAHCLPALLATQGGCAETLTPVRGVRLGAVSCREPHRFASCGRQVRQVAHLNVIPLFPSSTPQRALQRQPQGPGWQVLQLVHHLVVQCRCKT